MTILFTEVAPSLAVEISNFAKHIRAEETQARFNHLEKFEEDVNADNYLNDLSNNLETKIRKASEKLSVLKRKIVERYDKQNLQLRKPKTCCKSNTNQYESFCDMIPSKTPSCEKEEYLLPDTMISDFKDAYEEGVIKKVYYGDEKNGHYVQYPSPKNKPTLCRCSTYDPRVRPWYAGTVTPKEGKDVVIAVDFSKNGERVAQLLKDVTIMLLQTINAKDNVVLLPFKNSRASTIRDIVCSTKLVPATPAILYRLKTFLQTENKLEGDNEFVAMFKDSFSRFSEPRRKKVILFVTATTDPKNGNDVIRRTIIKENQRYNHEVLIHIYSITESEIISDRQVKLTKFAEQDCQNLLYKNCNGSFAKYPGKHVNFNTKVERDDLRSHVGSLYSSLVDAGKDSSEMKFTLPYFDYFGAGKLVDACLPMYSTLNKKSLFGVVCVSFGSSELLNVRLINFKESVNTYAFLIDDQGTTYIHPKYEEPILHNETAYLIHIQRLETSKNFQSMFSSMVRGDNGKDTVMVNVSVPRGDVDGGAKQIEKEYAYTWKKIRNSLFSLAVVVSRDYKSQAELSTVTPATNQNSLYHRFSLNIEDVCKHSNGIATMKSSSIHLSSDIFIFPDTYHKIETKQIIAELMHYFDGGSFSNNLTYFIQRKTAASLRNYVAATNHLDVLWKNISYLVTYDIYWRYIGLRNGMFRSFPGHFSRPNYDPRIRPWYILAADSDEELVITAPYEDFTSKEIIATLAKRIYMNSSERKEIAGVMGIDLRLSWLRGKVIEENGCNYLSTRSCMIMDKGGFLVYHPEFLKKGKEKSALEESHITQKEPNLATELIKKRYLTKKYCLGYHKLKPTDEIPEAHTQMFYQFVGMEGTIKSNEPSCLTYEITSINSTNLYLVKLEDACSRKENCHCKNGPAKRDGTKICRENYWNRVEKDCECPCYYFYPCTSKLEKSNDMMLCQSPNFRPFVDFSDLNQWQQKSDKLERCIDPKCNNSRTTEDCKRSGCVICERDKDEVNLKKWYCSAEHLCPGGTEKGNEITNKETNGDNSNTSWYISSGVLGALFLIAIATFVFKITRRKKEEHVDDFVEIHENNNIDPNDTHAV